MSETIEPRRFGGRSASAFTATTLRLAGGDIHVRETGEGRPVVLLHSSASSGRQWDRLAAHLARRYRVFVPDLPGYGRSEDIFCGSGKGMTAQRLLVEALAERAGAQVHLVGHSYGGAVALKIAVERPDLVSSLTVIEPAAFALLRNGTTDERRLLAGIEALEGAMNAAVACDSPLRAVAHFIDHWNGKGSWDALDGGSRDALARRVGRILRDFRQGAEETFTKSRLADLPFPVLSILGTRSPQVTRTLSELVAAEAPVSSLHMIAGAGHMLPVTHPHIVDPIIAGHLLSSDLNQARDRRAA